MKPAPPIPGAAVPDLERPSLAELFRVFFQIGCISFGGAAGQIALMHRMLVDERKWIAERDFVSGLNFCTLLPGPEAQQLATYIGWRLQGLAGGTIAGLLFVLPGALLILLLAQLYAWGANVPSVQAALLGVKAAVIAILIEAVLKIGRRALGANAFRVVAFAAFLAMMAFAVPFPLVIIAAAFAGLWIGVPPPPVTPAATAPIRLPWRAAILCIALWWMPVLLAALVMGPGHLLVEIGLFFSKLAVITFGGAYALLAYLSEEAVLRGWVSPTQMLDALGFAETTPGPTILVNPFVAFLAGWQKEGSAIIAWLAGLMALWTTFAPSFLWIFVGAPSLDRVNASRNLRSALAGISAAVVGIIATVGTKFAILVLFPQAKPFVLGPIQLLAPAGAPDLKAMLLAALALALSFILHWSMLRMLGMVTIAGLALFFVA
ncbi:MAG: chromate efflux transporter [Methylobacterium sp.]|nr:chromate efflux transporter [Methylobacterium sp.]MCA3602667.1 chromate efflux transporter [Methylobacterium sp.]MCA3613614.1 chromate efflux transporter [Methylobacterium sp.]MCA3625778.1 chromate efflux transporter [Methylobacterium sp.]MCA4909246.1 chromate efflux transporter [Methylobacterium sp.]